MKSESRKYRPSGAFTLLLLAAFAFAAGCSGANTSGGAGESHIAPSGQSVPGWMVVPAGGQHAAAATQEFASRGQTSSCVECHGADLTGGISRVSCFGNTAGCHHGSVAGWVALAPAAQPHGVAAKRASDRPGFVSCQVCHGREFTGGGAPVSCFPCHGVNAPHPAAIWRGPVYTHTDTNQANAPVCASCHFPGSPNNPANHPAVPAPAGTAPGCFNSTLCHGGGGFHPEDNWAEAGQHGPAAKGAVTASTGFAFCQTCHGAGADFAGGSSQVSCYPCHGVEAPHPVGVSWVTLAPPTHRNTNTGNAPVCALCHQVNPGVPDCFNNTMCH